MKTLFSRLPLLALMLIAFVMISVSTLPTRAQDDPPAVPTVEAMPVVIVDGQGSPANSVPTPVVIGGAGLFGLIFIGLLYNLERVLKIVAPLMKPEDAMALVTASLPTIMDTFMNTVAKTIPTQIDDKAFIEAARQRGLTVIQDEVTGNYHTTRTPPASQGSTGAQPAGSGEFPRTPGRNA